MPTEKLRTYLRKSGRKQVEVAEALGLTADKLSKVLSGKRQLSGDEVLRLEALAAAPELDVDAARAAQDLVFVRHVDISYSMGDGAIVDDYPDIGLVPYNLDFIRAITRTATDDLFIATGHGDSMEPTLLRSDLLMIDTSQRRIAQQDQIWALSYAGAGMVKRVRRQRGYDCDELVIMSDNASVPDQVVPAEDVHVVGRLIWVGRRM